MNVQYAQGFSRALNTSRTTVKVMPTHCIEPRFEGAGKGWLEGTRKWIAAGLIGSTLAFAPGCSTDVSRFNDGYNKIPVVQVEQRSEYLLAQMSHQNEKVRLAALEKLPSLDAPFALKLKVLLKGLDDSAQAVNLKAIEQGKKIASLTGQTMSDSQLGQFHKMLDNFPWTRTWQEQVGTTPGVPMMIPDGNNGFIYIPTFDPVYETRSESHGNPERYQQARSAVEHEWLKPAQ